MSRQHPPPQHNTHHAVVKQQHDAQNVWNFENRWHDGFCQCKPFGRFCFTLCCSCCMGCRVASRLGESFIFGCLPCCHPYLRTKLRTARRIKGNCCTDSCVTLPCCCACSFNQIINELDSQGLWAVPKAKKVHPRDGPSSRRYSDDY